MKSIGDVSRADVFEYNDGRSKGCGVVEFFKPEDAKKAIKELNGSTL